MLLAVNGVVRIATDLETKFKNDGKQITSFSVVSSDKWKTQTGEQREDSCFIKVTAFGGLAKILSDYCHKGSKIYIAASLKQDEWVDQQGQKKSMHSLKIERMEMLGTKDDSRSQDNQDHTDRHNVSGSMGQPAQHQRAEAKSNLPENNIDITDQDIPF